VPQLRGGRGQAQGGRVVVVPGESTNVKITEPGDLRTLASMVRS